ncbi:MAG: histidine kinase [Pseudomonadota bacterium]
MFKLLRFYSIASFISIFVTAALLTLFYRQVTIQWITQLAEKSNAVLAQTALNSIRPELIEYLDAAAKAELQTLPQSFPPELVTALRNTVNNTSIIRLKIYNHHGMVIFSTIPSQIGADKSNNAGFKEAITGRPASKLIYRDTFNAFEKTTEQDNLLQSYIPVRSGPGDPALGVFEIYTDVNPMVHENERILFVILLGAELIMAALFALLVLVVRRANQHLETQQQGIRKRALTLEVLSDRLLHANEQEKKKIAFDLHEGLAQTLSAIKTNVESSRLLMGADNENAKTLESIVPVIQNAIQEARSIATDLRPSSLDELGLLPTIKWFCREFERLHRGTRVEQLISGTEGDIPAALKIVIYRIIESAFGNIAQHDHTDWIQLVFQIESDEITLKISTASDESPAQRGEIPDLQLRFAEAQERTMLSGGVFLATQDLIGTITLSSTWPNRG